jgi:hypothetical protein
MYDVVMYLLGVCVVLDAGLTLEDARRVAARYTGECVRIRRVQ